MKLRKPMLQDAVAIQELINGYAEQGLMLARSRNAIYEALREFVIAEDQEKIVGVGALHIIWDGLAEVRALAVRADYKQHGLGKAIVRQLIEEARGLGVNRVFALTYSPQFFRAIGFIEVSKNELSQKVWKECINCPKFPNCDEMAFIYDLEQK